VHNYGSMLTTCHLSDARVDAFVLCSGLYHDYLAPYVLELQALFTIQMDKNNR
jgi:hypothetical protein